jgi:DNA invertase Pin-like site-specific DNA recombinase
VIQRTAINKWLAKQNIAHSSVQWFIDREDKTEFQQLSRDIENGSIQTLVLYSLEQAYPSIPSITLALCDCSQKNMTFASVSQDIFFNQESINSALFLLTVVLNLADHHKRMKQRIGIEKAQAKGLYKGKPPGATKPGFDPKKVLRWKQRGWSGKRIAKKLGVAESTVWRYLRIQRGK